MHLSIYLTDWYLIINDINYIFVFLFTYITPVDIKYEML